MYSDANEIEKIPEIKYGFVSAYKNDFQKFEFSYLTSEYSKIINSMEPYNFDSKKFSIIGISGDEKFNFGKIYYDFAKTDKNKSAAILGFESQKNPIELSLQYRKLETGFQNPISKILSQNNFVGNENGLLFGIETNLIKKINAIFIVDSYKIFYNDEFEKIGKNYSLKFETDEIENFEFYYLFKFKDFDNSKKINNRFHFLFRIFENLLIAQRIEFTNKNNGFLAFTDFKTVLDESKIDLNFRIISFNFKKFEDRIYEVENEIPGYFTFSTFNGKGMKFYFLANYKPNKNHNISIKISSTNESKTIVEDNLIPKNQINFQYDLIF